MTEKIVKHKRDLHFKRKLRTRAKISGCAQRPRVSIFRSNRYFYAQAIDDIARVTLASASGKALGLRANREDAKKIGAIFAETLKKANITEVVFDRNGYLYHGVVSSFADSMRENGIML